MERFYRNLLVCALVCVYMVAGNLGAYAADTPRWVNKGVKELNDARSNLSYEFVMFNTHDSDLQRVRSNNSLVLADYVQNSLGAKATGIKVNEDPSDPNLYRVTYFTHDNVQHWIVAMLVDTSFIYDEYEETYYEYEFFQLYAISKPDVYPAYDEFLITKKYKSKAVELSLIPGLGQIYKGQDTKGYVILGGELVLIGGAIYFEHERAYCNNEYKKFDYTIESWKKKSRSWGAFRNLSIGAAVALYVYNLVDAAYSNGVPQVVVNKRRGVGMSFLPYVDADGTGVSVALAF